MCTKNSTSLIPKKKKTSFFQNFTLPCALKLCQLLVAPSMFITEVLQDGDSERKESLLTD